MTSNGPSDHPLQVEQFLGRFSSQVNVTVGGKLTIRFRAIPDNEPCINRAVAEGTFRETGFMPADFHLAVDIHELEIHSLAPKIQQMVPDKGDGDRLVRLSQWPPMQEVHQPFALTELEVTPG